MFRHLIQYLKTIWLCWWRWDSTTWSAMLDCWRGSTMTLVRWSVWSAQQAELTTWTSTRPIPPEQLNLTDLYLNINIPFYCMYYIFLLYYFYFLSLIQQLVVSWFFINIKLGLPFVMVLLRKKVFLLLLWDLLEF